MAAVVAITGFTIARQPTESALGLVTIVIGLAAWRFASSVVSPK